MTHANLLETIRRIRIQLALRFPSANPLTAGATEPMPVGPSETMADMASVPMSVGASETIANMPSKNKYVSVDASETTVPGSDAQPAKDTEDSTAGQTAGDSDCYKLAFYNIGSDVPATPAIDALSPEISQTCDMVHDTHKRIIDGLISEIRDMVYDKCVDAVGISVLFNPKDDRWQQLLPFGIKNQVVWKLNSSSERRANSADSSAEPPAWKGQSDGHYVVAWNSQRLLSKACDLQSFGRI